MLSDTPACFGGVGVDVQFAVTRPAAPQDVEHLVFAVGGVVVAREVLAHQMELVVERIAEEVAEPGVGAESIDVPLAIGIGGDGRILFVAELIGAIERVLPMLAGKPVRRPPRV